jgi:hypothetical protein
LIVGTNCGSLYEAICTKIFIKIYFDLKIKNPPDKWRVLVKLFFYLIVFYTCVNVTIIDGVAGFAYGVVCTGAPNNS